LKKILKIEKTFPLSQPSFQIPTPSSAGELVRNKSVSGLHIIANLTVTDSTKLMQFESFKDFINRRIQENNLCKVGEVYHNFNTGGFTAVICLTESHLSIHTWPEINYLTFDIFLSNYLKNNRSKTERLYQCVKEFFPGKILLEQFIDR
jgi:S-adenosylmethionine decarboxylase